MGIRACMRYFANMESTTSFLKRLIIVSVILISFAGKGEIWERILIPLVVIYLLNFRFINSFFDSSTNK